MLLETILGTAEMMRALRPPPSELADEVTSPGGLTSRALHELNEGRFAAVLNRAIRPPMDGLWRSAISSTSS